MGTVLTGTHDPIDCARFWIVPGDGFRAFRGEPYFAADKLEAVGTVQRSSIDIGQRLLCDQIDDGECVITAAAVDRNIRLGAIGRGNDLVRVRSDRKTCDDLKRAWVHGGQRVGAFRQCQ